MSARYVGHVVDLLYHLSFRDLWKICRNTTLPAKVIKEDGKIIGGSAAEVLCLSPHRSFLNDDNNSLRAIQAIPLDVGIDAVFVIQLNPDEIASDLATGMIWDLFVCFTAGHPVAIA